MAMYDFLAGVWVFGVGTAISFWLLSKTHDAYDTWCAAQNDNRRVTNYRKTRETGLIQSVPLSDILQDFETYPEGLSIWQKTVRHAMSLYIYCFWLPAGWIVAVILGTFLDMPL